MWTIVDISKDLSNPTRLTRLSVVFQLPLLVTGAKLAPVSMVLKNLLVHIMTQVTKQNDLLTTQLLGEGSANYGETFNIYIYIYTYTQPNTTQPYSNQYCNPRHVSCLPTKPCRNCISLALRGKKQPSNACTSTHQAYRVPPQSKPSPACGPRALKPPPEAPYKGLPPAFGLLERIWILT